MARGFFLPNKIISGQSALEELAGNIGGFGKKALIVTGKTVCTLEGFHKLEELLKNSGVDYEVYTGITGEPDDNMIKAGSDMYAACGCDFLISMGGGSPIDSMKAIAVWAATGKNICDFYGKTISMRLPKMVAIPTTAGTGSEATQFTVITDSRSSTKMLLKGPSLMPDLAIIDASLAVTTPKSITASTGLDALTHSVEAYTSKMAQPLTDGICVSAVKRIFKYLVRAYEDNGDMEARSEMAIAAMESGIAINNSSVTIVHGMSRPIGALFHVPHGTSNAMLLHKCISFATDGAYGRFADLGRVIGVAGENDSDEAAAEKFTNALAWICEKCDIPTLEEYGIPKEVFMAQVDKMASDALASGSPANTLKEVTREDIINIYKSLYR